MQEEEREFKRGRESARTRAGEEAGRAGGGGSSTGGGRGAGWGGVTVCSPRGHDGGFACLAGDDGECGCVLARAAGPVSLSGKRCLRGMCLGIVWRNGDGEVDELAARRIRSASLASRRLGRRRTGEAGV